MYFLFRQCTGTAMCGIFFSPRLESFPRIGSFEQPFSKNNQMNKFTGSLYYHVVPGVQKHFVWYVFFLKFIKMGVNLQIHTFAVGFICNTSAIKVTSTFHHVSQIFGSLAIFTDSLNRESNAFISSSVIGPRHITKRMWSRDTILSSVGPWEQLGPFQTGSWRNSSERFCESIQWKDSIQKNYLPAVSPDASLSQSQQGAWA